MPVPESVAALPAVAAPPHDERIVALDILRGLALWGMLVVHFHQKMELEATGLADLPGWIVYIFVEQKAWGTFAFLFGVGFAVLLRRLEAREAPIVSTYLRRLAALAAFGLVAQIGFGFHILLAYACWGVVLLLVHRWPTTALVALAIAAASVRPLLAEVAALAGWPAGIGVPSPALAALGHAVDAAARGKHYAPLLQARWALFAGSVSGAWVDVLPDVNLALFLVGLLAVRLGAIDSPRSHVRLIRGAVVFGLASWAASWIVLPHVPTPSHPGAAWPVGFGFGLLQDQWLCLAYVGGVLLLLTSRPAWADRLSLAGDAGRMALTNYMLQCIVLDVLASGYGLGLRIAPVAGVVAATALFVALALASRLWLARYRYGPLEWTWRTATYWAPQTLRRTRSDSHTRNAERGMRN